MNHNSNQQQRFITLLDIIYDKNIPLLVTANQNLMNLVHQIIRKTYLNVPLVVYMN